MRLKSKRLGLQSSLRAACPTSSPIGMDSTPQSPRAVSKMWLGSCTVSCRNTASPTRQSAVPDRLGAAISRLTRRISPLGPLIGAVFWLANAGWISAGGMCGEMVARESYDEGRRIHTIVNGCLRSHLLPAVYQSAIGHRPPECRARAASEPARQNRRP